MYGIVVLIVLHLLSFIYYKLVQVSSADKSSSVKKTTAAEDPKKLLSSHTSKHSTPSSKSDGSLQGHSGIKNDFAKPQKSSSSKHSTHSSQKPPHKQPKPPFTPQQLAAATLSKPKPKLPAVAHEGGSKEHSNHSQDAMVNSSGTDDMVKFKQKSGDSLSLEAYKQKKAKQNELLQQQQQQQQLQQLPQITLQQHRHGSKRPFPSTDEHKSKKLKELTSLSEAQKKEQYKRQLLKQQQAALQHLPPLPPPLPKGSSGTSPPPPPPPPLR